MKGCAVSDSTWRPSQPASRLEFSIEGASLRAELVRWPQATCEGVAAGGQGEELGAVLEGAFELVCGDERYRIEAGNCALIPPGEPHSWRALSASSVLYRVVCVRPLPSLEDVR